MSVAAPRVTERAIDALVRRRNELKNSDDRGFSLIELLVVVLIIGVLAAIAIPIYLGSVATAEENALKAAATQAKSAYAALIFENPDADATLLASLAGEAATEASTSGTGGITVTAVAPTAGYTLQTVGDVEFKAAKGSNSWTTGDALD